MKIKHTDWTVLPPWGWLVIGLVLLAQSTLLFVDARRRGAAPWFWGILGIIQFPWPTVFYLLIVRKAYRWFWKRR
jgi:hypothetical protein